MKRVTNHTTPRAVRLSREGTEGKRRQRRVWAGQLSIERAVVWDAEAFAMVEGNIFFAANGEAEEDPAVSKNPGTHARTY